MATLVFDIETIGEPWDDLSEVTKKTLTRHLNLNDEEGIAHLKDQLGLSPLTGSIVALGMFDVERHKGAVYSVSNGEESTWAEENFTFKARTERELLEDFWEGAQSYDTFVTFNGRAFDVPFILHRSVVNNVTPTISLCQSRYLTRQTMPYHVDLCDELSFYGAMSRKPSLHLLCRAYGIESPHPEIDGHEVAKLFLEKKFRDLAAYNAKKVIDTAELYDRWKRHLAPASFLNSIEF